MPPRPSRRNFLRLRLWTTAGGLGLLAVASLPWVLLAASWLQVEGNLRIVLVLAAMVWGLLFLPLAWLGWKIVRLAWRPLVVWQTPRAGENERIIEGERVE